MRIHFKDQGHIYWEEQTNVRYKSVTTFKKEFVPEFPERYMSIYKAVEKLSGGKQTKLFKDFILIRDEMGSHGVDKDTRNLIGAEWYRANNKWFSKEQIDEEAKLIIDEWTQKSDEGKSRGTAWHNKEESKAYLQNRVFSGDNHLVLSPWYTNNKGADDRPRLSFGLPDGAYVELLMALHPYQLAGQADRVFIETIGGLRYVDIDDWKTDKALAKYNNYKEYFKAPISHLMNCNFNEYSIQLSMYMYMCEFYGFVPRKIGITRVREDITWWPVPYLKKEIENLLEVRKKQLIFIN